MRPIYPYKTSEMIIQSILDKTTGNRQAKAIREFIADVLEMSEYDLSCKITDYERSFENERLSERL